MPLALIAALLLSPERLDGVREALGSQHGLVECDSWESLTATSRRRAVTVALIDLFPASRSSTQRTPFEALRRYRRRFPSVTVVLHTAVPPARPQDLFEAGRFGIEGLALVGMTDGPKRLRALIDRTDAGGALAPLRQALAGMPPTVRDALQLCVTRAHQKLTSDDLARILGLRRKLLSERLSGAGYPTPRRLIAWGRLIVAARLLEDRERTVESVAVALDYPSGSAFRNAWRRFVGAAPQTVRERGGTTYVIDTLLARVNARRAAAELAPRSAAAKAGRALGTRPAGS